MASTQICLQFLFLLSFIVYSRGQFGGTMPTVKTNPNTAAIPVFVFQGDGYSSEESWAYYNDSSTFQSDLISYTVCHRLQMYYDRPRMYLFTYASSDEETNELYSEYHLGRKAFRICKRGTKYCSWHKDMPDFYLWRHICIAYDGLKDLYKLFVDGEKVDSGTFAGDNAVEVVRHGGLTYLGQDQDSLGGGFNGRQSWSGTITQFNIWSFALEDYFMENAAECRSDILGDVEEWALDKWVQSDIEVITKPLFELCGASSDIKEKYFLFPDPFDSNFYTAWCRNMGGGIAVPESEEGYHEMMDIAESMVNRDAHEKCMHASGSLIVWGGPTDIIEEDLWADPYTKEPLAYKGFWESGQPNGGNAENCIRTYIDRRWQDKDCQEKNCALCHFPIRMNLSIRGLCPSETKLMEGYYDNFYFIRGFLNLKPHWRGLGKSHIYFRPRRQTWRLESFYDLNRYAEFAAEDTNPYDYYPTGRSRWLVNEGICQMKGLVEYRMSLTNCMYNDGSGYDFTCTDGTCVPMEERCDLVDNCPDGSDERDCDILAVPSDYRNELFPITTSGEPLQVTINVTILAFPEINTLELSFVADFVLLMRWVDPRLKFQNLRETVELNSLSLKTQLEIWTPSLSYPNARQAEGTLVDSGSFTRVMKLGMPLPDDIKRAVEAKIYKGEESPLVMSREYFVSFNCDFDLVYYPFDTQICMIELEVNGIPKRYLSLGIEVPTGCPTCDGATYLGKRDLVEYIVGDSVMEDLTNESEKFGKARVKIVFKRRWIYHLITVFIQSILLLAVAYLTFYFKVSNFQDRIMIAITTMMVVATIQSSINKMVPKTSYFKMVDYWLLYSFNIIIIIMGVHTIMDSQIVRDSHTGKAINPKLNIRNRDGMEKQDGDEKDHDKIDVFGENPGWQSGWVKANKINFMGQVINLVVFFLFNIVFWSIALNHYYSPVDMTTVDEE